MTQWADQVPESLFLLTVLEDSGNETFSIDTGLAFKATLILGTCPVPLLAENRNNGVIWNLH